MLSFDETGELLDQIVDELPDPLLRELSAGVWLSPDVKLHAKSLPEDPLYVMGEYQYGALGRAITLYYGSFAARYQQAPPSFWAEQLKTVLLHELTHHNESLAGVRNLEQTDAQSLQDYLGGAEEAN
jgi:predicted Zn-dependent protease with MMP-like domain